MYSYKSRIGFSQTDTRSLLTPTGFIDFFQDAAIFEAEDGIITMDYLKERKLAWLLGSWQVIIKRRPKLGEYVEIITVPYEFKSFIGNRNFCMKTEDGEVLAIANSVWTLIDMENLKPHKPTKEFLQGYDLGEKLAMDYKPRKINVGEFLRQEEMVKIGKHHLDSNGHVNNAEYVNIAMSYLPEDANIREIRAEYKNAAYEKDEMIPMIYQQDNNIQIKLQNAQETVYAVIEFGLE